MDPTRVAAVKSPDILILPFVWIFPPIPTPPDITNAPFVDVVDDVVFENVVIPDDEIVVTPDKAPDNDNEVNVPTDVIFVW